MKKSWLRVTVLATAATGLAQPDVFYFGNAVGETGNSATDARVTSADALRVLSNLTTSAAVTNRFDINRDGRIGAADRLGVLGNISALDPLILLDLAGGGALQNRGRLPASAARLTPSIAGISPVTGTDAGTDPDLRASGGTFIPALSRRTGEGGPAAAGPGEGQSGDSSADTTSTKTVSAGSLRLQWISDGTPVTLWTTESLDSADWEILEQFPAASSPGTPVDVVLPVDPDGPARFYRLESGSAR